MQIRDKESILLCLQLFLTFFILLIFDERSCIEQFRKAAEAEKIPGWELISPTRPNTIFL